MNSNIDYIVKSKKSTIQTLTKSKKEVSAYYQELNTKEIKLLGKSIYVQRDTPEIYFADLIITEYAIHNLITFKWAFYKKPKLLALWGHGKTYTKRNTFFEEWFKTKLVNHVHWFFGYTSKGVESVVINGFDQNRTTVVQNSVDTNKLKELVSSVTNDQVKQYKNQHGIKNGNVGIFIGSLNKTKRINFLIKSSIKVKAKIPDFQLLIYGLGSDKQKILKASKKFPHIKYCGEANLEAKAIVSKFAQLIIMPGRVGLIAVDSFALGLPIITTEWRWHAPEVEYLVSGKNSLICENSLEKFSNGIIELLNNKKTLELMKYQCLLESNNYSIEKMAKNFHSGVIDALNLNKIKMS